MKTIFGTHRTLPAEVASEGRAGQSGGRRFFDALPDEKVALRVRAAEVAGRLSVMESMAAPGCAAPLHSHAEEEVFLVLAGRPTFRLGDEIREVGPVGTVVIPAGTPYAWINRTDTDLHMIAIFSPGGVEELFTGIAGRRSLPWRRATAPSFSARRWRREGSRNEAPDNLMLRALLVTLFAIAAAMKLTFHPFETQAFDHFGYAMWFMLAIGVIELTGAFALLHDRLLMPAAGLLGAVLLGALFSHMRVGDPPAAMIPALVALALLAELALLHRPSLRRTSAG